MYVLNTVEFNDNINNCIRKTIRGRDGLLPILLNSEDILLFINIAYMVIYFSKSNTIGLMMYR